MAETAEKDASAVTVAHTGKIRSTDNPSHEAQYTENATKKAGKVSLPSIKHTGTTTTRPLATVPPRCDGPVRIINHILTPPGAVTPGTGSITKTDDPKRAPLRLKETATGPAV